MPKCPPHIYVCIKNRCFSAKTCLNASPGQSVPGAHGAAHHGNVLSQAVHLQCSPGQAAVPTIRNAGPTVKERCPAPVSGSLFLALPAKRHSRTLQDCCCPPIYITALLHQMLEDKAWDPTGSPGAGRQDPESSGAEQSSSKAVFTREPRDFLPEGNSTRL